MDPRQGLQSRTNRRPNVHAVWRGYEDIVHCWTCKAVGNRTQEIDKELAEVDPKHFPIVVKVGIAPAMTMDPTKPYWGSIKVCDQKLAEMDGKTKKLIGCRKMHTMRLGADDDQRLQERPNPGKSKGGMLYA